MKKIARVSCRCPRCYNTITLSASKRRSKWGCAKCGLIENEWSPNGAGIVLRLRRKLSKLNDRIAALEWEHIELSEAIKKAEAAAIKEWIDLMPPAKYVKRGDFILDHVNANH